MSNWQTVLDQAIHDSFVLKRKFHVYKEDGTWWADTLTKEQRLQQQRQQRLRRLGGGL